MYLGTVYKCSKFRDWFQRPRPENFLISYTRIKYSACKRQKPLKFFLMWMVLYILKSFIWHPEFTADPHFTFQIVIKSEFTTESTFTQNMNENQG